MRDTENQGFGVLTHAKSDVGFIGDMGPDQVESTSMRLYKLKKSYIIIKYNIKI